MTHLLDLLLRRTSLAFVGGLSLPLLEELAGVVAPVLGWDDARAADEIQAAVATLAEVHGVDLAAAPTSVPTP